MAFCATCEIYFDISDDQSLAKSETKNDNRTNKNTKCV
jgi:hypothetical protein